MIECPRLINNLSKAFPHPETAPAINFDAPRERSVSLQAEPAKHFTMEDSSQAPKPIFCERALPGTSAPSINKWMEGHSTGAQQTAKTFLESFHEAKIPKNCFQNAAAYYGVPVGDVSKLHPQSVQQVICV